MNISFTELVSVLALLVQAGLVWLAYRAIGANEAMAKKRAIVDHILKQRDDPALKSAFKMMYECRETKGKLSEICKDATIRDEVLYALDQLEFIAVGIHRGAFDESVYKDLQCTKIIKTWESAAGFIMDLRQEKGIKTLYRDLEDLALSWEKDPIKPFDK